MNKRAIISFLALYLLVIGLYIFCHSTPERSIRAYLFFDGHMVGSIRTEVFVGRVNTQYGKRYSTRNPGFGPDFISVKKDTFGLWFVDLNNSGGG